MSYSQCCILDSRALFRMDMRFCLGMVFWPLLTCLAVDPCPFGLPEIWTGAHVFARALVRRSLSCFGVIVTGCY